MEFCYNTLNVTNESAKERVRDGRICYLQRGIELFNACKHLNHKKNHNNNKAL